MVLTGTITNTYADISGEIDIYFDVVSCYDYSDEITVTESNIDP